MEIKELLRKKYLNKIPVDKKLIEKELKEAKYDLERAKISMEQGDLKWAILKLIMQCFIQQEPYFFLWD